MFCLNCWLFRLWLVLQTRSGDRTEDRTPLAADRVLLEWSPQRHFANEASRLRGRDSFIADLWRHLSAMITRCPAKMKFVGKSCFIFILRATDQQLAEEWS